MTRRICFSCPNMLLSFYFLRCCCCACSSLEFFCIVLVPSSGSNLPSAKQFELDGLHCKKKAMTVRIRLMSSEKGIERRQKLLQIGNLLFLFYVLQMLQHTFSLINFLSPNEQKKSSSSSFFHLYMIGSVLNTEAQIVAKCLKSTMRTNLPKTLYQLIFCKIY